MKKIISVFLCILMLLAGTGISTFTASAATPAEKAQPFFYFETAVDAMYVYFFITEAAGISSGEFTFSYDPTVFSCSSVQQAYESAGNYIFAADSGVSGEVFGSFAFNGNCPVDELDVCIMKLDIIGEVHDVSYAEMGVDIDGITFTFEAYPIEIVYLRYGDVDIDQNITAADARLVLRASVGLEYFSETQVLLGDVDASGTITAADARLILRASVGLEVFE